MDTKIVTIATANPRLRLSQRQSYSVLSRGRRLTAREDALYRRFLSDRGIGYRYFSLRDAREIFAEDQDLVNRRFEESAQLISAMSLERCLRAANVDRSRIRCLAVSTCTGYLCPGLTSYIIEKAALRSDIFSVDVVGMGCGAAMPALQACHHYLKSHEGAYALAISTEISSSAVFWGDDPQLILSNSIFGDGSAACLLTNESGVRGFRVVDFESRIAPQHRDALRFRTEGVKLRNVIKEAVPRLAATLTKEIASALFERNGVGQDDIAFWAFHPGGRKVLDAIQQEMNLSGECLGYSRRVLHDYGNMSSPTVLYVLNEILKERSLRSGDMAFMASFGAGFSGYAGLLCYE